MSLAAHLFRQSFFKFLHQRRKRGSKRNANRSQFNDVESHFAPLKFGNLALSLVDLFGKLSLRHLRGSANVPQNCEKNSVFRSKNGFFHYALAVEKVRMVKSNFE